MTGIVAHLHLSYIALIFSIPKSSKVWIDRMTSFKYYKIILIKINTELHASITIVRDCDKQAAYRNMFTGSYVIYPECGSI